MFIEGMRWSPDAFFYDAFLDVESKHLARNLRSITNAKEYFENDLQFDLYPAGTDHDLNDGRVQNLYVLRMHWLTRRADLEMFVLMRRGSEFNSWLPLPQVSKYRIMATCSYALLSTFTDDDEAEKVNQLYSRANHNELDWSTQEGMIVQDAMRGVAGSRELEEEINEFIEACYRRHRA